jgi:hypothetical protein
MKVNTLKLFLKKKQNKNQSLKGNLYKTRYATGPKNQTQ